MIIGLAIAVKSKIMAHNEAYSVDKQISITSPYIIMPSTGLGKWQDHTIK